MSDLLLRYLAYFGPEHEPASITFEPGLNVVCGSSDTGKSFIVESIDFMLGQEEPVRDIPERNGYDQIRLVLESNGYPPLTLDRSIEGGNFHAYEGIFFHGKPESDPHVLRWKHAATRSDTLSYELLSRIGCAGKVLRKNAAGKTRTLSFRDIARLCIVTEQDIQRRGSPVLSGQWVTATSEYAAFKFMLTGNDDNALVAANNCSVKHDSNSGKIELLDQIIGELQAEIDEAGVDERELKEQEENLNASLEKRSRSLQGIQQKFSSLMSDRADVALRLRNTEARMLEINEFMKRFSLLDRHYTTDIQRLQAIYESGSLFIHLEAKPCPMCGAIPGDQHLDGQCKGNTQAVIQAATAELEKIQRLRRELVETMASLQEEYSGLEVELSGLQAVYEFKDSQLNEIVSPSVLKERASYNEIVDRLSSLRIFLDKIARMQNLIQRRIDIEIDSNKEDGSPQGTKTIISKSILDEFSKEVQRILEEWEYPYPSRVFFDESKKDIQISGKERGSTGKGLRAITHAAFTIGLMQFCRERGMRHPGFVVLDSPLLAYWKPESQEDDLRGTNLKNNFYRYLLGMSKDNQIIIIENEHPPVFIEENAPVTIFTKNPTIGTYGFFPPRQ